MTQTTNRQERRSVTKTRCKRKVTSNTGVITCGLETIGKTDSRKTRDKRKKTRPARLIKLLEKRRR